MTTRFTNRSPLSRAAAAVPVLVAGLMLAGPAGCEKKKKAQAENTPTKVPTEVPPAVPPVVPPTGNLKEISNNPAVLHDASVPPQQFELYGVKLGDLVSVIPAADLTRGPDDSGLVEFRGKPNVFRVDNGKIAGLYFNDVAVLARLGIQSEADLIKQFGSPDAPVETSPTDPQASYTYKARLLTVIFSPRDKQVLAVNVNAE